MKQSPPSGRRVASCGRRGPLSSPLALPFAARIPGREAARRIDSAHSRHLCDAAARIAPRAHPRPCGLMRKTRSRGCGRQSANGGRERGRDAYRPLHRCGRRRRNGEQTARRARGGQEAWHPPTPLAVDALKKVRRPASKPIKESHARNPWIRVMNIAPTRGVCGGWRRAGPSCLSQAAGRYLGGKAAAQGAGGRPEWGAVATPWRLTTPCRP